MRRATIILTLLFSAVACADGDPQPTVPDAHLESAKIDFAARLQVAVDEITVVEAEPVTWSSGAMGCAQSGGVYTPAEVEGYLIVLQYLTAVGNYHQGGDTPPFLCLSPTE